MPRVKAGLPTRTNNQIREILLRFFYDRNRNATSSKGEKGSAVKISDVKRELISPLMDGWGWRGVDRSTHAWMNLRISK